MLRELSVRNLALIEDARVDLQPGYCAWTGETGAGKSLLLTALGLVLGGKATSDLVRAGKSEAHAAAVFEIEDPDLRNDLESILGGAIEGEQVIVSRRVTALGKSSAMVNDMPVTAGTLRLLGARLIDLHGQHESRALLDPERQRALLDAHGHLENLVATYRSKREVHLSLRTRKAALTEAVERRRREQDLLLFEYEELSSADPKPGEFAELTHEAHRLANIEHVRIATSEGYRLLYEVDGSVQELIDRVARQLGSLATPVPELGEPGKALERIAEEVREVAYSLRDLGRDGQDDPDRLEEVESRLALYRRLTSRFRCGPDDLAERRAKIEDQLASLENDESGLAAIDAPLASAWREVKKAALTLSGARHKAGKILAKAVQIQLRSLCLADARIEVVISAKDLGDDPMSPTPGSDGADHVEFVFAPNPGEKPKPLRMIASGGELSRVTLAAKTVLAEVDRVPTLVFDEIDTGVGGRLGAVLGRTLAKLAKHRQVLCVTHLPQMASFARHQWVIRKQVARGRTRTTITPLTETARVTELAAMLRGDSAEDTTRAEVLAMLAEAQAAS